MATPHWALKAIRYNVTATGVEVKAYTFQPCHLWLRWTTEYPQEHSIPVIKRGLAIHSDKRFCFVAYHDNEQSEGGDTTTHTFLKEPWSVCETRYLYFHGRIGGVKSPSTTAILSYHRLAPPVTAYFYSDPHPEVTSVDGMTRNRGDYATWAACLAGAGWRKDDAGNNLAILLAAHNTVNHWIGVMRSILLFDTSSIPPGSTITSAKLRILTFMKTDDLGANPTLNVFASNPATNTALILADHLCLSSTPLSTDYPYADWVDGNPHYFILNGAGLNQIIPGGITKLGLRESTYEATGLTPPWVGGKNVQLVLWSSQPGEPWRPRLEVSYT